MKNPMKEKNVGLPGSCIVVDILSCGSREKNVTFRVSSKREDVCFGGVWGGFCIVGKGVCLYYYGARYYDARTSIFISVDAHGERYPDWSPYSYVFNNPLKYIDPTGLDPECPECGDAKALETVTVTAKRLPERNIQIAPFKNEPINGTPSSAIIGSLSSSSSRYDQGEQDNQQETQTGSPTIFVNMYATPKGFDVEGYLTSLKSALIANGFSKDLVVERSSIIGNIKAWWNDSPTATVTIKNFRLGQDRLEAGGYATLNDPHSMIIYNGLSATGANKTIAMWKYINATVHEIGHGLFGFDHDSSGMTSDPSSIMDYRSTYTQGAGFNGEQKVIIMESIWGR